MIRQASVIAQSTMSICDVLVVEEIDRLFLSLLRPSWGTYAHAELPENSPRYVVLSYELNHSDGRKSFPLVLVNWAPISSEMGLLTLHASAFLDFQTTVRTILLPD